MPIAVQIFVWAAVILFGGWIFLQTRAEAERIDRRQKRLCRNCGYDLRASPDICPECGMAIADEVATLPLDKEKLRGDWPSTPLAPRQPGIEETPLVLHRTDNGFEANLLQEQLTMRGIVAQVRKNQATHLPSAALYQSPIGDTHEVVIWSADEAAAKSYLATLVKPVELIGGDPK
jgi:hypothetical protein